MQSTSDSPAVSIENLRVGFGDRAHRVYPVDGVTLEIGTSETLALVGESGSGKTLTGQSLARLLPKDVEVSADKLRVVGQEVLRANPADLRAIRSRCVSLIFQDPMTALNPVFTVRSQLAAVLKQARPTLRGRRLGEEIVKALREVGISDPEDRLRAYPHQLSGGLRQRVMIALALASSPRVVIADEPTTALDASIHHQILGLLKWLQREQQMAMLLITHDFSAVADVADRVAVMYSGKIVETGRTADVLKHPAHPYTQMLIASIPGNSTQRGALLPAIPGRVPRPDKRPTGCHFSDRCPLVAEPCYTSAPSLSGTDDHQVACFNAGKGSAA
ncbi:ABC transporter ATP-binding protein [Paenarthrobacter sp. NPDC089675]|uniref:ABC transporter ATP-binding protein n=1 Tax=Paenarthrobacter sp. NPDC089675 TaxID=3364376 RepID=UPI0037F30CA0